MALQDLTPQLRTRMTRAERLVGLFVFFALLLTTAAFVSHLVQTGKRRGWLVRKIPYYCYTRDATGLKPGDPVRLLGRDIGRIVQIETTPADPWFLDNQYNVFVKFEVWDPYFGYILTDSRVRVVSVDFFGARYLELTRGDPNTGLITVGPEPRWEDRTVRDDKDTNQMVLLKGVKKGIWLLTEETPGLGQRADHIVSALAAAIPAITNRVDELLFRSSAAVSNANVALVQLQPVLTNLQVIAARLDREEGAIGRMLLTTNLQAQVSTALGSMDATLTNTTLLIRTSETQLQDLTRRIALTLDNVALVTSNLSAQVNANSLVLGEVSSLVVDADDMVQGLKKHWLLRSAFGARTNPPIESGLVPSLETSPR